MAKRPWKFLSVSLISVLLIFLSACGGSVDSETDARSSGKALTFEEAAQVVLDELVKPEELDHELIVFGWPEPLTMEDELHPYAVENLTLSGESIPVDQDAWLFWIEDVPAALFKHHTRFVLVDVETGEFSSSVQDWWPVLNGESLFVDDETYWDESIWIYSNLDWKPTPKSSSPRTLKSAVSILPDIQVGETDTGHGLVVHGWSEGQSGGADLEASAFTMSIFLKNSGFDTTTIGTDIQDRPGQIIDWILKKSEVVKSGETVMIYLAGHGWETDQTGAVLLGEQKFWESDLVNWLDFFEPDVHVIVVVDACFSGSWIDGLRTVADVTITSTSAHDYAYTDIDSELDPNHDDIGTEFSSGFAEDWLEILNDTAQQEDARSRAKNPGTSYWQEVAALSYLSAVEKDYAHIKGLSFPNMVRGDASTRVSPVEPLLKHVNASPILWKVVNGNLLFDGLGDKTVSDPSWDIFPNLPSTEVNFTEVFWAALNYEALMNWHNDSYFECGTQVGDVLTICAPDAGLMPEGEELIAIMVLDSDIPLDPGDSMYQFGFVLDSDNDQANNFQFVHPYTMDYFQDTDLWYVVYYHEGWKLEATSVGIGPIPSNARAAIIKNILV